jgi:hypothetical protein
MYCLSLFKLDYLSVNLFSSKKFPPAGVLEKRVIVMISVSIRVAGISKGICYPFYECQ